MKIVHNDELLMDMIRNYNLDVLLNTVNIDDMKLYELSHGDRVCASGDEITHLYFLVRGRLKVYTTMSNGKSLALRFNDPLSLIGDVELVTKNTASTTVECVRTALLIGISYSALEKHYSSQPAFLHFLLEQMCYKLTSLNRSSSVNLLYPLDKKFAGYLTSILLDKDSDVVSRKLPSQSLIEIADLLGTSYRHLNRVVRRFTELGILERERGELLLLDEEKLKELAPDDLYIKR
ncbi:cyclic nucleotide-binding domain-containing protein [Neobacillus mesonae]|nr:cyclic nucleotide-binding domain-containing protein [Neobacillus mesonae]